MVNAPDKAIHTNHTSPTCMNPRTQLDISHTACLYLWQLMSLFNLVPCRSVLVAFLTKSHQGLDVALQQPGT